MSVTEVVRSPAEYEERLQKYLFERSEEGRAVRVGEKEVSEQAAIVARYTDLFSRAQLASLHECEDQATDSDERERLYRLRKTCEAGLAAEELAEAEDEFENKILAARLTWNGEEMPLRNAQAKLAVLDDYRAREELGELHAEASAAFNPQRLELLDKQETLEADLTGIAENIERNEEEKQVSLRELEQALSKRTPRPTTRGRRYAIVGSTVCSARSAPTYRLRSTARTCVGSPRSSRPTRRSVRSRSAWRRCAFWASTWRTTRTSGSTSTTVRRSRRAHV